MSYLKSFFILLLFSFIFTNCSMAQEKPTVEITNKTNELSDKVNPETKRFESKAGNFSINISQEPLQTRNLEAEKGQQPGKQFFWQFEKTVYTIMFSDFNESDLSTALDQMNSGTRMTIERTVGKSFSEKEISYGKYPGREFVYIASNGIKYVMRNFLVNKTGYLITTGYADEESEKEALKVLNSFELLSQKK